MSIDWLEHAMEGEYYKPSMMATSYKQTALARNGLLILDDSKGWLQFAVLEWAEGDDAGSSYSLVFHGCGKGSSLRECRHTWWGENSKGYVFYPNGILIADAFLKLSEWFDDMVEA